MSEEVEIINLYVNRTVGYDLILNNVQDSDHTKISYEILSENKYKNTGEPICTIIDNKLIAFNEGTCDIIAHTNATSLFNAAESRKQRIIINKNNQSPLQLYSFPIINYLDTIEFNVVGGSIDSNPIIYSTNSENCVIENNKITFNAAGIVSITARKEGNFLFNPIFITWNITVLQLHQPKLTITVEDNEDNVINDTLELYIDRNKPYNLTINNINETPSITWEITNLNNSNDLNNPICKIIDNKLIAYNFGTCILKAKTSKTNNYLPSESSPLSIVVLKKYQNNIVLNNDLLYYNSNIKLLPSGGNTNSDFIISLEDNNNCTLSNNILYGINPGECIITIKKKGDDIYDDIINQFNIEVNKVAQMNAYIYLVGAYNSPYASQSIENKAVSSVFLNRDISFQIVTENTRGNPNVKYKFLPRNILNEDSMLYFYYTFDYNSTDGLKLRNDAKILNPEYDATMSINGLVTNDGDINGRGTLTLNNTNKDQYIKLKSFLNGPNGITISFWGKMNQANDKALFLSLGNGYHNEEIYLGQNKSKLFAGYSRSNHMSNIYEKTLNYPFQNFNNDIWHYITWIITPTGVWKFYLDGLLIEIIYDIPYPAQIMRKENYIGYGTNNVWANMSIDSFRLYNKSLSDNEVKYLTDYSNIYTHLNIDKFYLDSKTNLKLFYSFQSYTIENSLNFNGINATPPPILFTNNELKVALSINNSFMNGIYNALASSEAGNGYNAFNAFNNSPVTFWNCASKGINNYIQDPYTPDTGLYQGGGSTQVFFNTMVNSIGNLAGEWLQIKLPYKLILKSYSILSGIKYNSRCPKLFYIVGSNDGESWNIIDYKNLTSGFDYDTLSEYNVKYNLNIGYQYFRLIINKLAGGDNNSTIVNIRKFNIAGNYLNEQLKNVYQIASSEKDKLNYNGVLSRLNIIKNEDIIDYALFDKTQNDYIKINNLELIVESFYLSPVDKAAKEVAQANVKLENANQNLAQAKTLKAAQKANSEIIDAKIRLDAAQAILKHAQEDAIVIAEQAQKEAALAAAKLQAAIKAKADAAAALAQQQAAQAAAKAKADANAAAAKALTQLEVTRLAAAALKQKQAVEAALLEQQKAAELEAARIMAETEKKRLATEALILAQQKASEAEKAKLAAEAAALEQQRAAEAEKLRIAAEAEKTRLAAETEKIRIAAEVAALEQQKAAEAEQIRIIAEKEKARLAEEAEKEKLAKVQAEATATAKAQLAAEQAKIDAETALTKAQLKVDIIQQHVNNAQNTSIQQSQIPPKLISSELAFVFWFNTNQNNGTLFEFNNINTQSIISCSIADNKIKLKINTTIYTVNFNVNDNIWRHIVWNIKSNATWDIYINNILISTNINGIIPTEPFYNNNYLGKDVNNTNYFTGGIADFRVYYNTLTNNEIYDLYNFKIPVFFKLNQYNDLILYYPLSYNSVQNLKISNLVNNNFDGTISNKEIIKNIKSPFDFTYADLFNSTDVITLAPFTTSNNGLSITFWYCLKSLINNQVIFEFSNEGENIISVILDSFTDSYYALNFYVSRKNNKTNNVEDSKYKIWLPIIEYKKWNHITWTFETNDNEYSIWKIYVDGKLFSLFNNLNNVNYPEIILRKNNIIGKSLNNNINFIGSIAEFRIYNRTLNFNEIKYFSTNKFFPIFKFENNSLIPYNFGGLYIQSFITETTNFNFGLSKTLYLDIYKNNQPDFKITGGFGESGLFDGSTTSEGIDGFNTEYLNSSISKLPNILGCFGTGFKIFNITNQINNESFIIESNTNSLIYTTGNKVGSRAVKGDVIESLKITKIGDNLYNDFTKIYNIYIKKNNRIPFSILLTTQIKTNYVNITKDLSNNLINSYTIKIDRNNPFILALTNYNNENKVYSFISNGIKTNNIIIEGKTIASIDGNNLYSMNEGTITLICSLTGTNQFNEGTSINIIINIVKNNQQPLLIEYIPKLYYKGITELSIYGGNSSNQINYTSGDTSICTITNNKLINGISVGAANIIATKLGDDFYYDISLNIPLNVLPIQQKFNIEIENSTFDGTNSNLLVNRDLLNKIILTNIQENPEYIKYSVINSNSYDQNYNIITISKDGFIKTQNAGACLIIVEIGPTQNYVTTVIQKPLIVSKNKQSPLTLTKIDNLFFTKTAVVTLSGGLSTSDYILSTTSNNCSISGLTIKGLNTGNCEIIATKPSDFMYDDITKNINVEVQKIIQPEMNITIENEVIEKDKNYTFFVNRNNTYKLICNNYQENPYIIFTIYNQIAQELNPVCIIKDNLLIPYNSGECYIKAVTTTTKNYLSSESNILKIIITKKLQSKFLYKPFESINFNKIFIFDVSGGNTDNQIIMKSNNNNCEIINNLIKTKKSGQSILTLFKEGNEEYENLVENINFNINKIDQPETILQIENLNFDSNNDSYTLFVNPEKEYKLKVTGFIENPKIIYNISNNLSSDPSNNYVYTLQDNLLVLKNIGIITIEANLSETNNYKSTTTNKLTIIIIKNIQLPLYINYNKIINFKESIHLSDTGGSVHENHVIYTINNPDICLLNLNTEIIGKNVGTCNITATKEGNFMYLPITFNFNIIVEKIHQTVSIQDIATLNEIFVDKLTQYDLKINNLQEDAEVIYIIVNKIPKSNINPEVCKINNDKLIGTSAGKIIIKAIVKETKNYLQTVTDEITITVSKKKAKDFKIDSYEKLYYNSTIKITTDGGQLNDQIIFSCENNGILINKNNFTGIKAGEYTIIASKLATNEYEGLTKTFKLIVNKLDQVSFRIVNNLKIMMVDPNTFLKLVTSNINDNAKVMYKIIEQKGLEKNIFDVCTINNDMLIPINAGTCKIIAITSETENYNSTKSEPVLFTVKYKIQEPLLINKTDNLLFNSITKLDITGGTTNNPYIIESLSPNINIIDNLIVAKNIGVENTIRITKLGNFMYDKISTEISFNILPIVQSELKLENINTNNIIYLKSNYNLVVSNAFENPTISYNINNINSNDIKLCNIKDGILYPIKPGSFYIQAVTDSTKNYLRSYSNQILVTIYKLQQTKLVSNLLDVFNLNEKIIFSINGGSIDSELIFENFDKICKITKINETNFELIGIKAGKHHIKVIKYGDEIYENVELILTFKIKKIKQPLFTIKNINETNTLYINNNLHIPIELIGVLDNAPVNYTIKKVGTYDTNIVLINNNTITPISEGACILEATTLESDNYLPTKASNTLLIKIEKNIQKKLEIKIPKIINYGERLYFNIIGGSTTNSNKYIISNDSCKILNTTLIGNKSGICDITIIKDGDHDYQTISSTISLTVNKIFQPNFIINKINETNTIYVNPNNKIELKFPPIYETTNIYFEIISSESTDTSNNICSFDNRYLIPNNKGTIIFRAYTNETTNYYKTISPQIQVTIVKNDQENIIIESFNEINYMEEKYISCKGGSTNSNIIYSCDSSNCYIEGNKIVGANYGKTNIVCKKLGNFMYYEIIKTFQVNINKIKQKNIIIQNLNHMNEIDVDPNSSYILILNNVKETPKIVYTIISMKPAKAGKQVIQIKNNLLIPLNAGKCVISASTSETNNYLPTTTSELTISVKLKTPADFKIDIIPKLFVNSEHLLTTDGGQNNLEISYTSNFNGIKIDGHKIKCTTAGNYLITATQKENFMFDELQKTFKIIVNKLEQPNFKVINIAQLTKTHKYLKKIPFTEKFYNLSDVYNGNLTNIYNNTELIYIGKNLKEIDSFIYNVGTQIFWTNSMGTGFNFINIKDLLQLEWYIKDINIFSWNEIKNTMEGIIIGIFKETGYVKIIKLNGNPSNIKSYTLLTGYNDNFKSSYKNLICGSSFKGFYCNFNLNTNAILLGYTNNQFFIRSAGGADYKYLQHNKSVPNVFIYTAEQKYLTIVRDYELYKITDDTYPSYTIQINNINNSSLEYIGSNQNNSNIYILNSQYIFILCLYNKQTTLFCFDMNNKFFKIIYSDPTNKLWGFNVIDLNNIVLLIENKILSSNNYNAESTTFIWDPIKKVYIPNIRENKIIWTIIEINKFIKDYQYTNEFKFYPNNKYFIIKKYGIIFMETNEALNTYLINSPISLLTTPILENADMKIQLISSTSKLDGEVCKIAKNQIFPLIEGSCKVKLITSETTNYKSTESEIIELNFDSLEQDELVLKNDLSNLKVNDEIDLVIYGGNTDSQLVLSALTNNFIINGNRLKCTAYGNATIFIYKEGNSTYNNIMNKYDFFINKGYQKITLNNINTTNELYVKKSYNLIFAGVKDNAEIKYNIKIEKADVNRICYIDNKNKLVALEEGVCSINIESSFTNNYLPSTSNTIILTIRKNEYEKINFKLSNNLYYKSSVIINDSKSSDLIEYIPISQNKCTIQNNLITGISSGKCTIVGIKHGNNIYNTLMEYYTFTIKKISQPSLFLYNINESNTIFVDNNIRHKLTLSGILENATVKYNIIKNYDNNNIELDFSKFNGYIMGDEFIGLKNGYCDIQAMTYETDNYLQTKSNIIKIKINKMKQELLSITKQNELKYLSSTQLLVLGGSTDNDVIYIANNNNVTIQGNRVFGNHSGHTIITAIKKGNANYEDISVDYDIIIKKTHQDFYIKNINDNNIIEVDTEVIYDIDLINLNEKPSITYNIQSDTNNKDDNNKISIVKKKLFPLAAGKYIITAISSETANYLESKSKPFEIKIIKKNQVPIYFTANQKLVYRSYTDTSTWGGNTENEIKITSDSSNCVVLNTIIHGLHSGFADLKIYKQGNFMYEDISIETKIQIIGIPQLNFKLYYINPINLLYVNRNNKLNLLTSGVEENAQIVYIIVNSVNKLSSDAVCIINGDTLIAFNEGYCTIQAKSLPTTNFTETLSNTMVVTVMKNKQDPLIIDYKDIIDMDEVFTINGHGGSDTGSSIIYTSDSLNCQIKNNSITAMNVGVCLITAFKSGNFMYSSIQTQFKITVKPVKQKIIIKNFNQHNELEVDPDLQYSLELESVKENPKIIFKIISMIPDNNTYETVCELNNNLITPTNAGICIIKAYASKTKNYLESETPEFKVHITLKSAKNFIIDNISKLFVNSKYAITVDKGQYDNEAFEITSKNPNIYITYNKIISNIANNYTLFITRKGNFQYKSLTKEINITINKLSHSKINILNIKSEYFINRNKQILLKINNLDENPNIKIEKIYESNKNTCIISNQSLTAYNEGTCIIKVVTSETMNYNSSSSNEYTIKIIKNEQSKLIIENENELLINNSIKLNIRGGNTISPFIFNKNNDHCFIRNEALYGISAGQSIINIYKEGDEIYKPITIKFTVTIYKNFQNIKLLNFNKTNSLLVNDSYDIYVDNIKENGNLKYIISDVIFEDDNVPLESNICIINDNKITVMKSGICTLQAIVSETKNYNESKSNKIVLTIYKKDQKNLLINSMMQIDTPIVLSTNYNSYLDLNINGGNTETVTVISNNENCLITKI